MNTSELTASIPTTPLREIPKLPFPKLVSGKVREVYDLGDEILMIATDRISAFDVILPGGIQGKGILLTQLSLLWFKRIQHELGLTHHIVKNHDERLKAHLKDIDQIELLPRSMLVQKLEPVPLEAVVRGYLSGSAWNDYQNTGKVFGLPAAENMQESQAFDTPLFTPTTKAHSGHDEPISEADAKAKIGDKLYDVIKEKSLKLYEFGNSHAQKAGILLADTKFEFGLDPDKNIILMDEALTPDSSRYWPLDSYTPGRSQHAYDKQYVRDYLNRLDWDKTPPGPELPQEVVQNTLARYLEAYEKLS